MLFSKSGNQGVYIRIYFFLGFHLMPPFPVDYLIPEERKGPCKEYDEYCHTDDDATHRVQIKHDIVNSSIQRSRFSATLYTPYPSR